MFFRATNSMKQANDNKKSKKGSEDNMPLYVKAICRTKKAKGYS